MKPEAPKQEGKKKKAKCNWDLAELVWLQATWVIATSKAINHAAWLRQPSACLTVEIHSSYKPQNVAGQTDETSTHSKALIKHLMELQMFIDSKGFRAAVILRPSALEWVSAELLGCLRAPTHLLLRWLCCVSAPTHVNSGSSTSSCQALRCRNIFIMGTVTGRLQKPRPVMINVKQ